VTAEVWRALVVEDDRSWQQILSENLADAGLEVDVADSLEMA
jgi:DNA-binding response OmpR family regulator